MSEQSAYIFKDGVLSLTGNLTVYSISRLFKSYPWKDGLVIDQIDCSLVTSADSSCLALFLYLQTKNEQPITIRSLPENLKGLVGLYELSPLLSLSEN